MAYIQANSPPPNKIISFTLDDFSGGLNNHSDQPEDNQATNLLNMSFVDDTLMERRKGQEYFDDVELPSTVTFIDEFRPYSDADALLRATDSELYLGTTKLTDLAGRVSGTNHSGKYFFADGGNLYVYGKFTQKTTTYEKVIGTPVDDYVLMKVVSPADGHPQLGTEHVRGVLNIDYTNKKIFYEPCEHEFKDPYKGANKVPEKVKYIVSHDGRLFVSGAEKDDDNVFITDVQNPYYFCVSLPIQLPPNSDKVVGMAVYNDAVIVGRKDDLYAIHGKTNRPNFGLPVFELKRINTHTGFANHNAIDVVHNYLFFLGSDSNFYALTSAMFDEQKLSTTILNKTIDLKKPPINIGKDEIYDATSIFYKDEWYVSIKDKVLIYSYVNRAWTMYNNIDARSFYVFNNDLIWGREDGRTAKFSEDVYLDFGLPYESFWESKYFYMDDASLFKQFREFFLVAHVYNDYRSDVNVSFNIDYAEVKDKMHLSNQISVWGKAKWGDRFIKTNISASLPFVIGRRGRNIQFRISNGYFIHGDVDTYADLEYYIGRKEGVLVRVLDTNKLYLYTNGEWVEMLDEDLNQRMKIYQVNGDYEMRGRR